MEDHELLRGYVKSRSQDAFRQLVERHLPMVHATARRLTGDAHLAEEIAQSVFVTLAQKAGSLRPPQTVGGWIYTTTRNLAMHAVRSEQRRRQREQTAVAMQTLTSDSQPGPILDQLEPAMEELTGDERDALVLRFLENRNLREVGLELGVSEDAARMRVNRALEQLRAAFGRRGVVASSTALATALGTTTAAGVPIGLASAVSASALAATGVTATIITMSINAKLITAMIGAILLTGTGTYLWQQCQIAEKTPISARGRAVAPPPGTYITKDKLGFVGYDTPEAAWQSIAYIAMTASLDTYNAEMGNTEKVDANARRDFAKRQKILISHFKGMQIVAKKTLSDNKVDLKFKLDLDPIPNQDHVQPQFLTEMMVKEGNAWKSRGANYEYLPSWDETGDIQRFE